MKTIIRIPLLACLGLLLVLSSCNKEGNNLDDFSNESMFLIDSETRSGKRGCYELVFPVTIGFPDGTSQELDTYIAIKAAVKAWRMENEPGSGRPHISFPYEILNADGEVITIENKEQRRALRKACRATMGQGPDGHHGKHCFKLKSPISILFPDGTTVEVEKRRALKRVIRKWKMENPQSDERPQIVFPIVVILEDGSSKTIEDKEALKALKEECRG